VERPAIEERRILWPVDPKEIAMKKKPLFGGKKAAPFGKGGGRKGSHPNTAKGTPRKSKAKK